MIAANDPIENDPCSSCGTNTLCKNGQCYCIENYSGDPYYSCQPECIINSDCSRNKACKKHKCYDPCPGSCGLNAMCQVINHLAICTCPQGMSGNAFVECKPYQRMFNIFLIINF